MDSHPDKDGKGVLESNQKLNNDSGEIWEEYRKNFNCEDFIIKDYCNTNIKEVWNIGVADYFLGNYIKKYTSQCNFDEIVYEIKMNLRQRI